MLKQAVVAAALGLFISSSFAMPVTIDFGAAGDGSIFDPNGMGNDNRLYRTNIPGHLLTVTGYKGADLDPVGSNVSDQFDDREEVTRDIFGPDQGLGVDSDSYGDSDLIDGLHRDEALRFMFSGGGTLTQIVFNHWDSNDDFDFAVDGIATMNEMRPGHGIWNGEVEFLASFAIGADGGNDDFRVRSITVDFDTPVANAVPVPGTFALVGLGLVSLFARRRV